MEVLGSGWISEGRSPPAPRVVVKLCLLAGDGGCWLLAPLSRAPTSAAPRVLAPRTLTASDGLKGLLRRMMTTALPQTLADLSETTSALFRGSRGGLPPRTGLWLLSLDCRILAGSWCGLQPKLGTEDPKEAGSLVPDLEWTRADCEGCI